MMVTFISQCQKNALKKTRRVGDNSQRITYHKAMDFMFDAVKGLALGANL